MKTLIIYFTKDKKSYQVVKPHPDYFKGDWKGLVLGICGEDGYHSFEVL